MRKLIFLLLAMLLLSPLPGDAYKTDAAIHPEVGGEYQGREIKEILIAW